MKVLYIDTIGNPMTLATTRGIMNAWLKVAKVRTFDYRKGVPAKGGKPRTVAIRQMNANLLAFARKFRPNVIHLGKAEIVRASTIAKIKEIVRGCKAVHFYGDWRASVQPWVAQLGRVVDVTMFQHRDQRLIAQYKARGCQRVEWWWAGVDPDLFKPHDVVKCYDLIFMANLAGTQPASVRAGQGSRRQFLQHLADAGLRIDIFGKRTSTLGIPGITPHGFVDMAAFAQLVSAAKIALGYGAAPAPFYYSSPRLVKTMACGTCFLTHYFEGIDEMFVNGEQLVWFKSFDEAVNLARDLLKDHERREQIGVRGREAILAGHTWDHRVALIRSYIDM